MSTDFMAAYEQRRKAAIEEAKGKLLGRIKAMEGIERIDATFQGEGDDGGIQSITYYGPDDQELSLDDIPKNAQISEDDVYPLLPSGFEINEGSSGHVIFNLLTKKITVSTDWNQITTENETHEF